MEHMSGPESLENNGGYEKGINLVRDNYVVEIKKIQSLSKIPAQYDHLVNAVKAEAAVVVLQANEVYKSYQKDVEQVLPENKEKITALFKKEHHVMDTMFEVATIGLDFNAFDVWAEQQRAFEQLIEKLQKATEGNVEAREVAETIKKKYEDSMAKLHDAMHVTQNKLKDHYNKFIQSVSKDIATQIGEVMRNDKTESFLAAKANQDFGRLTDAYVFKLQELYDEARLVYEKEQPGLN